MSTGENYCFYNTNRPKFTLQSQNFSSGNHLGRNSLDSLELATKTGVNNNSGTSFASRLAINIRPRNDSAFVIVFRSRAFAEQLLPGPTSDSP